MIIGTAGHIDHGKTALVQALTDVDADRLKEEKARGITIDLGFAYLGLENGSVLGFVDVPGHERFIRNMLAGATGIDSVLLVVAADDGIMPQTREHLDIVMLLGLTRGAVALTKCDLTDRDRRSEVKSQVSELLKGTPLASAPVFEVSTVTSEGIAELHAELVLQEKSFEPRSSDGLFRLAVDRCFTLRGTGTVVTGAVISGHVSVGDNVLVSPAGMKARVRGMHTQNRPAETGRVGDRCALNLVGDAIEVDAISRGDFILDEGAHSPTNTIDAILNTLCDESRPLAHWTPVRLHHGASETVARLALLQADDIRPGETGRVQLVLDKEIATSVGDRFIVREAGGARTLGGGHVIDLRGPRRRRRSPKRLAQLGALSRADPVVCLEGLLATEPFTVDIAAFARDRAMSQPQLERLLKQVSHVHVTQTDHDLVLAEPVWDRLIVSVRSALEVFHRMNPQILGCGLASLAKALEKNHGVTHGAAIIRQMVADGTFSSRGGAICLPDHKLALDRIDHHLWLRIRPLLSGSNRFRPPKVEECAAELGAREIDVRRVLKSMAQQNAVIELARDRFFAREALLDIAAIVGDIAAAAENGWFPAAALRNRLENGRKVSIEILEYFDRIGLTVRRDDLRCVVPHRIADFGTGADGIDPSQRLAEEKRPRWGVRTSNPGGTVSQS